MDSPDEEKGSSKSSPASSILDLEEHSPKYNASKAQKCLVVFITSFVTMTACFSSTSLMSAATQIADEFHTTTDVVNASNAGLLVTMGVSNFIWGPLVRLFGRMYAYNSCIIMLLVWTAAASVAPNLGTFIAFRVLSGCQGTFFHVQGQAILAEYFPPIKRGTATGFFLAGTVLGPPLGPLIAGVITQYTSWRVILYVQSGMVAIGLLLSLAFMRQKEVVPVSHHHTISEVISEYNPVPVFTLMRFPNLLLTDIAAGLLAFVQYALLASPRHILVTQYNLQSPLTSGLFFLSPTAGFLLGTLTGGFFSDRTVLKWIDRRDGLRLPQDRLRSGFLYWFGVIPIAALVFGWGIEKQAGGLALPIVAAFFVSMGILAAFAGLNTYCAEVFPLQRPEAIASKYLVQYALSGIASVVAVPMIDAIGVGTQCTVSVILVLVAGLFCVITALSGLDMQHWAEKRWPSSITDQQEKSSSADGNALHLVMSAP